MKKRFLIYSILLQIVFLQTSYAQHPIEVQRLAAKGEYFQALASFDQLPKRITTNDAIQAAARSAWGLGLPKRAISEFDRVLQNEKLDPVERARIYLSRAIIEYQEDRYQTSVLYAERASGLLKTPGPLRAKAWLVWGESLDRMSLFGAAEEKYLKALEEGELGEKGEIHYLLGECQMRLGKTQDARANFEKVPLRHEKTPQAMRALAQLALEDKQFSEAEFWLTKGRTDHPDSFLDSWVDYVLLRAAMSKNDPDKVTQVLEEAKKKYAPSDPWLNLSKAAVEAYSWGLGVDVETKQQGK